MASPIWVRALAWPLAIALLGGPGAALAAQAHRVFATPDAAMSAFGEAVIKDDEAALKGLLGVDFRAVVPLVGAEVRSRFRAAWSKSHAIQKADIRAYITVGDDGWTLPIPLVKSAKGWQFDTRAGLEEMRVRRIARDELAVIQAMLAISNAQAQYAQAAHDGSSMHVYASRLSSSRGKHDGLYWPTAPGEPPSPLGPAFFGAGTLHAGKDGYYGYRYKLLAEQGPYAPGGAYGYVVNGRLFGGFAMMAWPVHYQDTGVMSFMVSREGQVYERDLGADSALKAAETKRFDPGPGWRRVSP